MRESSIEVSEALTVLRADLESQYLRQLQHNRASLLRRMRQIWGPDPPKNVQANIERMLAEDLPRKAQAIARHHRTEIHRTLEAQIARSSTDALTVQIVRALVIFEPSLAVEEVRRRSREKLTLAGELARADRICEANPDPKLRRLIDEWVRLARSIPCNARHLSRLPLITCHDYDLHRLVAGNPEQRHQAAKALCARDFVSIGPWLDNKSKRHSRAKRELERLDKGRPWVREWLQNNVLPSVLVIAAHEMVQEQRIQVRLGKDWVLDVDGRSARIRPLQLGDLELRKWLQQRASQLVDEAIAGPEDPVQDEAKPLDEPLRLEDLVPLAAPSSEEMLMARERRKAGAYVSLKGIVMSLPARDRQLLKLRAEGRPYEEIAQLLGSTSVVVRKRFERLKKAIRRQVRG